MKMVIRVEITEVVSVHCNIVSKGYQNNSSVLYTIVPNKPFGTLLEKVQTYYIPLKTCKSEFLYIEAWFTDQNSQPLEIQDRINLTLAIK